MYTGKTEIYYGSTVFLERIVEIPVFTTLQCFQTHCKPPSMVPTEALYSSVNIQQQALKLCK